MNREALCTILLLCFCELAIAETVFIEATQDNTLYDSPSGRLSNGSGEHLFACLTTELLRRRAVIAFKNSSSIPEGATVTSVKLHMHVSRKNSEATIIELFRLTSDWGEGRSHASENEGRGANSEANDATWIHTFWSTFHWADPGGDFIEIPSDQLAVDSEGSYTFGSTGAMVSDVQEWLDQPGLNFGWILIGDEFTNSTRRFDSRENSDPALRPVLEVEFSTTGTSSNFAGPWFDPALDGEGYLVYQTPVGWLIYYFGYSADAEFLWLASNLVRLDQLIFGEPFELPMLIGKPGTFDNPTPSTELTPYGTLSVSFFSCSTGHFILDGLDGIKTSNVVKLTGVDGTNCKEP